MNKEISVKSNVSVFEVLFDIFYLFVMISLSINLILKNGLGDSSSRIYHLAGFMTLILFLGDGFYLLPRIINFFKKEDMLFENALGRGRQISSITITIFYVFLWHLGIIIFSVDIFFIFNIFVYILAFLRIFLCLVPQNNWISNIEISSEKSFTKNKWYIYRNLPFFFLVFVVGILFFIYRNKIFSLVYAWTAIFFSLLFYIGVIFATRKNKSTVFFMTLKSLCYVWLISMLLSI